MMTNNALLALVVVLVAACTLAGPCKAVLTFTGHRGIQYRHDQELRGVQTSTLDLEATALSPQQAGGAAQLGRRAVITPIEHFDERHADLVVNGSGAVLVLLSSSSSASSNAAWRSFEQQLLERSASGGLYVADAQDTDAATMDELRQVYDQLSAAGHSETAQLSPFRDSYHVSTAASTPNAPVGEQLLWNLHTVLAPSSSSSSKIAKPVIALVAHYDSFSAVPSLARGVDGGGSGAAVLLELARLFQRLFTATNKQSVGHELLLVLTGGDRLRFDGTAAWLDSLAPSLSDRVSYALCLDELAAAADDGDAVHLHVSRSSAKNELVSQLYSRFERVAGELGIDYRLSQRKINLADPVVYWQHEQFSRSKRFAAGTLSQQPDARQPFNRSSLLDRRYALPRLLRNVRFVAEALAPLLLNLPDQYPATIFQDDLAPSPDHLRFVVDELLALPRFTLGATDPADLTAKPAAADQPTPPAVVRALARSLGAYSPAVVQASFPAPADMRHYTPTVVQLRLYSSKPFSFELVVALLIFVYLLALYVFSHPDGHQAAVDSLRSLLKPQRANARK